MEEDNIPIPEDASELADTPTNVVDEGIELYHSRSKGVDKPRDFHAGTYQAAVDRSSFMFGDTNMYQLINKTQELAQEQVNDMLSEFVSDSTGKFEDGKFLEREILVDLPNGNQQPVNVLVETIDDTGGYKVMIFDKDKFGFTIHSEDGFGEAPANKSLLEVNGSVELIGKADDTFGYVAGFKPENKTFNYKDGYELYKVEIKPNANVITFTENIELVENGIKQNIDPDLFVNYLEKNLLTDIDSITLPDGKTIDLQGLSDTEKRNKLKNNIDVIGYRNQMEDVGSTSYYFLNNDAYTETLVDNATNTKFDNDVLKKFIDTNPNVGITDFKRASDERLNIVTDLLSSKDTPTNVVDDFQTYIINKYKEHFITEFNSMFGPVEGPEAGFNMFVKEDGTVFVDRLYLKPQSQKKGIGTEIMEELFEWSNKNNQPFEFVLMAGYDDLSSPTKTVQTQKAFQEKLKDVPGLEAFPSEQGLLDTKITTYKYTPQLDTPTNVIDLDNQVVIDTEYGSGRDITVTVDKNGNVVLFRGTDNPNRDINVNFESSVGRGEVGYGKGNYYSPNPQYAANYGIPSGRNLYGFTTDIKPNEIINFKQKLSDNIELAKKLGIDDIYWDVSNPNYKSFSWSDLFYEMDKEDVWNEAIGDYEVTKKSKYGRSWFQNNIDNFTNNGVKAFITTEVGPANYTRAEIFPLVTETNNLNIKPVVRYSVDGAGVNLSQFKEIPLDTPTNVVDDVTDFQNTLRNKYSNVIADIEIGGVKQPTLSLEPIPGQNSFVVKSLYIDDTLQGQGYGTQIMNDIIEFADNNNLQVELDISATNKSLAKYYERFGFVLSDETNRDMIRKPNTPTNVVDDKPTLNTDLVWETDRIQADGNPRWNDNIVPNNNILKPNLKNDDIKRIIPQILDGTVSDIDFTRFGIWLLHKSPVPAFGTKPFRSVDAIADVVKIVIFNGKSPIDLINEDTLDMLKNWIISDTGPFTVDKATGPNAGKSSIGLTDELILQFGREEGPFANAQQRMKQTIINEHNKLYADADDYFILFRGGALTNDPIQSFSKNGRQAYFIGHHMNQETIRQGGRGVDGYIVNKYDFIDLQSLGLDYGSEAEVIAYREGVNKPFQKTVMDESVRNFNYLDKNRLKFIDDNWIMISDEFPKTGFINSVDPTNPTRNQTLRVMEDSPDITNASTRVQQVAIDFAKTYGLAEPNFNAIAYFNPEVGVQAADIYQGLPDFDDNAVPLYNKFIKETNLQYDALNNAGLQFELVDTDPYTPNAAGHQQMINDMQNGRLKVLATSAAGEIPQGSPMAQQSGYVDVNGRPMLNNDVFRAVHDTFGHGMRGNTFGPVGEYNAWLAHKEMYSTTAQRVMTTETLGQNTWVNFGPHMRTEDGVLIGKGDSGYIGPADRPFAPQKVAVMPEDIITNAGNVVDNASELVSPGAMNKVQQFISNTPDAAEQLWKATKFTMGKAFRGLQVFDPGDIIIEAGLARLLPRLGLAAIAVPTLYAYVFYELAVLAVDAANGLQKAAEKQGVAEFGDGKDIDWKQLGKDTWSEMGEVSDTWSLSWKISEPIINKVFEEYGKMKTAKDEKDYFTNLDVGVAAR